MRHRVLRTTPRREPHAPDSERVPLRLAPLAALPLCTFSARARVYARVMLAARNAAAADARLQVLRGRDKARARRALVLASQLAIRRVAVALEAWRNYCEAAVVETWARRHRRNRRTLARLGAAKGRVVAARK